MSRAWIALLAACLVAGPSLGCRPVRALVVTPEEHAAFKPTRTRATLEERMHAAEEYLARYPNGTFAAEVRRSYLRADEALWASKRGSVVGLESYLATLPTGPHAKVARRELDAKRAARVDLLGRGAKSTEARLAAAAAARLRAREALGTWLRRFTDPEVFRGSMTTAPAELIVAWSLALPPPKCVPTVHGGRRCTKLVTETFEIPREGERELVLEVVVEESVEGRVCGVTLRGPALFQRWEEAASTEAISIDRAQTMRDVEALLRSTMVTSPGTPRCAAQGGSNIEGEVTLGCGEFRLDASPSAPPSGDDEIYLNTAYSCSSP